MPCRVGRHLAMGLVVGTALAVWVGSVGAVPTPSATTTGVSSERGLTSFVVFFVLIVGGYLLWRRRMT